jgi:transcriptional regulator, XRE family
MIINNDYRFIGSDLRKIRESKGISRKEISEKMYISEETIRRIEKGENDPRLSTLVPLCNYLDIDLKDIISGKEFEYKNLLSLRNEIHYLINNYSIEKATRLIKNLDELSFDSHIYYEKELFATRHYFNGVISVIKNGNRKDSLNDFEIALSEMNSKFKINKFKDYKYDNFSLRILLAIALNEYRIGNFELYKDIILVIKDYLDLSLDNYFLFAYNVAAYYSRVGNYLESLRICNEAANNAKIIKEAYYLNMLYYIKGVNHVYLEQLKEASLSFNYCLALTNIFSEKSLANSISKQISTLMANHK